MLYWAAVFFIIALLAAALGFGGLASSAASIAQILFVVFLALFLACWAVQVLALVGLVMIARTHGESRRLKIDSVAANSRSVMGGIIQTIQERLRQDIWGPDPDPLYPIPLNSQAAGNLRETNEPWDAPGVSDQWLASTTPYMYDPDGNGIPDSAHPEDRGRPLPLVSSEQGVHSMIGADGADALNKRRLQREAGGLSLDVMADPLDPGPALQRVERRVVDRPPERRLDAVVALLHELLVLRVEEALTHERDRSEERRRVAVAARGGAELARPRTSTTDRTLRARQGRRDRDGRLRWSRRRLHLRAIVNGCIRDRSRMLQIQVATHLEHRVSTNRPLIRGEPADQRVVADHIDATCDAVRRFMDEADRLPSEQSRRISARERSSGSRRCGLRRSGRSWRCR